MRAARSSSHCASLEGHARKTRSADTLASSWTKYGRSGLGMCSRTSRQMTVSKAQSLKGSRPGELRNASMCGATVDGKEVSTPTNSASGAMTDRPWGPQPTSRTLSVSAPLSVNRSSSRRNAYRLSQLSIGDRWAAPATALHAIVRGSGRTRLHRDGWPSATRVRAPRDDRRLPAIR